MIDSSTVLGRLHVVALTLWGEARSEGVAGMTAVAWVIRNRADHARRFKARTGKAHALYGDGYMATACLVPWQFTCWHDQGERLRSGDPGDWLQGRHYQLAFGLACLVAERALPDPTGGATHYCRADWLADPDLRPGWADAPHARSCGRKGAHVFFNLGERG